MVVDAQTWELRSLLACAPFSFIDDDLKNAISQLHDWPNIDCYNRLFNKSPFPFVEQDDKLINESGGYLNYIETYNTIPTRLHNLHDLMNALSWHCFPHTKNMLQYLQCNDTSPIGANARSQQQNAYTLFDESGIILISQNKIYAQLIRFHQWETLFWTKRKQLLREAQIICFGHGLLEKFSKPFIGLCGKLIHIELEVNQSLTKLDRALSANLANAITDTTSLSPFPILGWPGWHQDQKLHFYQNTYYFRPLPTSR